MHNFYLSPFTLHHYLQLHRTVVGAKDIAVNLGVDYAWLQAVAYNKVVNAPANVLLTCLETVGPPGVLYGVGIFPTEGVGEAACQQICECLALLVAETGTHVVGLGVFKVYLLVGHIQVATKDDRFDGIKTHQVFAEVILPRHAVLQTTKTILRVRRITADKIEVLHLECYNATFVVVQVNANAVSYVNGLVLSEDSGTRIAFLVSIVPVTLIAGELHVNLSCLKFGFLQTKEISVHLFEDVAEAFDLTGA